MGVGVIMGTVKRLKANGAKTNNDLRVIASCGSSVVSRGLYDNMVDIMKECHDVLDSFGVPARESLKQRIEEGLRLAEMRGAVDDDMVYQDYIQTLQDVTPGLY